MLSAPFICSAHPSPIDFLGIARYNLGAALAFTGILFSICLYIVAGLKHSSRAETVTDYFFYNKKASTKRYFDTTVAYSFQVVAVIYNIYLGFKYGIGISILVVGWLLGFYLFQLCAKKLLRFVNANETLHSFLAKSYNASIAIRRLTAICTIAGLLGALLVETNYTTDFITLLIPNASISVWILIFFGFLFITWLYIRYGGYKATVNTASIQLPLVYVCLAVVFIYLIWLAYHAGDNEHGFLIGMTLSILWLIIIIARITSLKKHTARDAATLASGFGLILTLVAIALLSIKYGIHSTASTTVNDIPDSFNLSGIASIDIIFFVGFIILNLAWQFCDMTAWQRISSINFSQLSDKEKGLKLRKAIGETKWESPVTYMFGIVFGIALRYSGFFHSADDAGTAFNSFVIILSDNDLPGYLGIIGTYIVLPSLAVAFVGIMLSTTGGFLNTITFAWIYDLYEIDVSRHLSERVEDSKMLSRASKVSLSLLIVGALLFLLLKIFLNLDIFIYLNMIYSIQFVITFFTLGALFLRKPAKYKNIAIASVIVALASNIMAAIYCAVQMKISPGTSWSISVYVLPTIASTVMGSIIFVSGILFKNKPWMPFRYLINKIRILNFEQLRKRYS
jgi:hypothetical protein